MAILLGESLLTSVVLQLVDMNSLAVVISGDYELIRWLRRTLITCIYRGDSG